MTVIVWHRGVLAHDNQTTYGNHEKKRDKKWTRINGAILVRCGPVASSARLLALYREGSLFEHWPAFQAGDNAAMLIRLQDGKVQQLSNDPIWLDVYRSETWGSGSHYARGALSMGADARRAVQIANQHSPTCGFGVTCHT